MEDCLALKRVTEFIRAVGDRSAQESVTITARGRRDQGGLGPRDRQAGEHPQVGTEPPYVHPEYAFINEFCPLRLPERAGLSFGRARGPGSAQSERWRPPQQEAAREQEVSGHQHEVPFVFGDRHRTRCRGKDRRAILPCEASVRSRRHSDRAEEEGDRMPVARSTAAWRCGERFIPESYQGSTSTIHSLKSWAMYLHVAHRHSFETLHEIAQGVLRAVRLFD